MSGKTSLYEQGHLLVAALRLFSHRHKRPPSIADLSGMLELSTEMVSYMCNRLEELSVLEVVPAAFDERIYLRDHLKLESLPREEKVSGLEEEVQKLQADRQRQMEDLQKQRATMETQKKDLFSDLERQLKEGIKRKQNPLDEI
jgi:hypothetical protein